VTIIIQQSRRSRARSQSRVHGHRTRKCFVGCVHPRLDVTCTFFSICSSIRSVVIVIGATSSEIEICCVAYVMYFNVQHVLTIALWMHITALLYCEVSGCNVCDDAVVKRLLFQLLVRIAAVCAAYCYTRRCVVFSACWTRLRALRKRLNRSRRGHAAPENRVLDGDTDSSAERRTLRGLLPDSHKLNESGWVIPTDVAWSVCNAPDWPVVVVVVVVVVARCDTIRDAILTWARKPTWVSLIYRTETTAKKCKN